MMQGIKAIEAAAIRSAKGISGPENREHIREHTYYTGVAFVAEEMNKVLKRIADEGDLPNKTDFLSGMEDGLREIATEFAKYMQRISK